jgi:aminoglycoside phosphotransferase (APT) family kinase protein
MGGTEVDARLVRALLREQHPDLAGLELRWAATGWDNQMWRLGDDLAVRVPRTERAPALLRKEHRWLPVLAPRLPLPIPVPVRLGAPSERFAMPWTITTWVSGEPGDRAPITRGRQAAGTLATFLRALHRPAPDGAPSNPKRGVPLEALTDDFEDKIRPLDASHPIDEFRTIFSDAAAAPRWPGPPLWLHADLHPANVVIAQGTLAGVIDFGELGAGDPATDLAAAWLLLPARAVPAFFGAYGTADTATIRRARGWAALFGVSLLGIGQAWDRGLPGGQPTWGRAGRRALHRLAATSRDHFSTGG